MIIGTGVGGLATLEEQIRVYDEKGPRRVSPFLVPMMMANAGRRRRVDALRLAGPVRDDRSPRARRAPTRSANAARLIASGRCDAVLAGGIRGGDDRRSASQGFTNMTALSSLGISRPFDAERDGFVIAEGAAVLVLEEWDAAARAGRHISARSWAARAPPTPTTSPRRRPAAPARSPAWSWRSPTPGIGPGDIAQINAHGTSTPLNDAAEAEAIAKVFGTPGPPVTSTKGVTGHALGAAGALEAAAVLLSMQHRLIPPTAGYAKADPDLHDRPRPRRAARRGSPGRRCRTPSASAATTAAW